MKLACLWNILRDRYSFDREHGRFTILPCGFLMGVYVWSISIAAHCMCGSSGSSASQAMSSPQARLEQAKRCVVAAENRCEAAESEYTAAFEELEATSNVWLLFRSISFCLMIDLFRAFGCCASGGVCMCPRSLASGGRGGVSGGRGGVPPGAARGGCAAGGCSDRVASADGAGAAG